MKQYKFFSEQQKLETSNSKIIDKPSDLIPNNLQQNQNQNIIPQQNNNNKNINNNTQSLNQIRPSKFQNLQNPTNHSKSQQLYNIQDNFTTKNNQKYKKNLHFQHVRNKNIDNQLFVSIGVRKCVPPIEYANLINKKEQGRIAFLQTIEPLVSKKQFQAFQKKSYSELVKLDPKTLIQQRKQEIMNFHQNNNINIQESDQQFSNFQEQQEIQIQQEEQQILECFDKLHHTYSFKFIGDVKYRKNKNNLGILSKRIEGNMYQTNKKPQNLFMQKQNLPNQGYNTTSNLHFSSQNQQNFDLNADLDIRPNTVSNGNRKKNINQLQQNQNIQSNQLSQVQTETNQRPQTQQNMTRQYFWGEAQKQLLSSNKNRNIWGLNQSNDNKQKIDQLATRSVQTANNNNQSKNKKNINKNSKQQYQKQNIQPFKQNIGIKGLIGQHNLPLNYNKPQSGYNKTKQKVLQNYFQKSTSCENLHQNINNNNIINNQNLEQKEIQNQPNLFTNQKIQSQYNQSTEQDQEIQVIDKNFENLLQDNEELLQNNDQLKNNEKFQPQQQGQQLYFAIQKKGLFIPASAEYLQQQRLSQGYQFQPNPYQNLQQYVGHNKYVQQNIYEQRQDNTYNQVFQLQGSKLSINQGISKQQFQIQQKKQEKEYQKYQKNLLKNRQIQSQQQSRKKIIIQSRPSKDFQYQQGQTQVLEQQQGQEQVLEQQQEQK